MQAKIKILQPCIGIIVTHPKTFFANANRDFDTYMRYMESMNSADDKVWYRVMANLPTHDFLHIYTVYDNKVIHRTNLVETWRNKDMAFPRAEGGYAKFNNCNGIVLGPPFSKAPHDITCPGFQGFRYVYDIGGIPIFQDKKRKVELW